MPKSKKRKSGKSHNNISPLGSHKREGKNLIPPMGQIPNMQSTSWRDDRLPEMLWAILLRKALGQDKFVDFNKQLAKIYFDWQPEFEKFDPTLTGISRLSEFAWQKFTSPILGQKEIRNALNPLLLFDRLPGYERWASILDNQNLAHEWSKLRGAVADVLFHQSQEATDCRWARIIAMIGAGRIYFPEEAHDIIKGIVEYPHWGDQREVRPSVRSLEGTFAFGEECGLDPTWCSDFWLACLKNDPCRGPIPLFALPPESNVYVFEKSKIHQLKENLTQNYHDNIINTNIDPKLDGAFGFIFYSLNLLEEISSANNSRSILGRIALRSILECYINFNYLNIKNDSSTWLLYRNYGNGQAKLSLLKYMTTEGRLADSIDPRLLEEMANEDRWIEFVNVGLGDWEGKNLRQRAIEGGTIKEYDLFYPWNSSFSHGNWSAVRTVSYGTCANPLHRLHRIPLSASIMLDCVISDSIHLINKMICLLSKLYPGMPAIGLL